MNGRNIGTSSGKEYEACEWILTLPYRNAYWGGVMGQLLSRLRRQKAQKGGLSDFAKLTVI